MFDVPAGRWRKRRGGTCRPAITMEAAAFHSWMVTRKFTSGFRETVRLIIHILKKNYTTGAYSTVYAKLQ